MNIFQITVIVIIFILIYRINLFLKNIETIKRESLDLNKVEKFSSYISMLEYKMNLAYKIIYKDRIMVYSIEAYKIDDNQLNVIVKDFINLTIKFLGPKLESDLIKFFGSSDTLYFIIGQKFHSLYEDDSIREEATDNIMYGQNNDEGGSE